MLAVDRYFLSAGRLAANPTAAVAAIDRCDRQMDGWTNGPTYRRVASIS